MCLLLLVLIFSGIIFAINGYTVNRNEEAFLKVGVVLPKNDDIMGKIIKFANRTDALKGFCKLEKYDYEEAISELENDELYMVLVIPDDFYDKSTQMEKANFDIYTKGKMSVAQLKFLSILTSVERIMATTEGSIYAMYDGINKYSVPVGVHEMEDAVMGMYVEQFLAREKYFDEISLSPFGEFSFLQYMTVSIVMVATLLSGVIFLSMYAPNVIKLERVYVKGRGQLFIFMGKIASIGLLYFVLLSFIAFTINSIFDRYSVAGFIADANTYIVLFLYSMVLAAFINLMGVCLKDNNHGRCLYIIITLLLSVLMGVLVPVVYLPEAVVRVYELNIFKCIQAMLLNGIWRGDRYYYLSNLAVFAVLLIPGFCEYRRKLTK